MLHAIYIKIIFSLAENQNHSIIENIINLLINIKKNYLNKLLIDSANQDLIYSQLFIIIKNSRKNMFIPKVQIT